MVVAGVSHITLSCANVEPAAEFYRDVLGFEVVGTWPTGAYLSARGLWLALVRGPSETRVDDYSHIAFHVDRHDFDDVAARIRTSSAEIWQDNWTEGDSLYFEDPDGHQLEIHATTFAQRVDSATVNPWEGLQLASNAAELVRPEPSIADPRKPRRLHCAMVGVFIVVVDEMERVLFLRDPTDGMLQVPNGARDRDEDPSVTAIRELREEAGPIDVGPMQCFAAFNVDYHPQVPPLLSIGYACTHLGGTPVAADDMAGFGVEWLGLGDVVETELAIPDTVSLLTRAIATIPSPDR